MKEAQELIKKLSEIKPEFEYGYESHQTKHMLWLVCKALAFLITHWCNK